MYKYLFVEGLRIQYVDIPVHLMSVEGDYVSPSAG